MPAARWDQRFFASTRGQIVALLRRGSRTVDDLADRLGLTDNAVRAHLSTLERDGLVRQSGKRPGERKPAFLYDLAPEADRLFPKAYGLILRQVLEVLGEQLSPAQLEAALREAGRRLAAEQETSLPVGADVETRAARAAAVLGELGGLVEVEAGPDGAIVLRGFSCPLAAVVPGHPEICHLAESLLAQVTRGPVHEHCERGDPPHCRFELAPDRARTSA